MKLSITHCITDDKFLDDAILMFDSIEWIENKYVIVSKKKSPFKYLKSKDVISIIHPNDFQSIYKNEKSCDVLILHGLGVLPMHLIPLINRKIKVVWFSWGYDIYSNKWPQFKLINIPNRIKGNVVKLQLLNNLKLFAKAVLKYGLSGKTLFKKAINRVDYYSGVFPIEYDLLKKYSFFTAKRIDFNYTKPNVFCKENIELDPICTGHNILVGNSASYYSNHMDSFNKIASLNLRDRKIVVPLSYGNSFKYVNRVIEYGKKLFGHNFSPITDFIPFEAYNKLLKSCSIAIFNIEQQAAVGNILIAIWNGTKIFMPTDSIGYRHFNDIGIKIYPLHNRLSQTDIDTPIELSEIMANRYTIYRFYSFNMVRLKLEQSLKTILHDIQKGE